MNKPSGSVHEIPEDVRAKVVASRAAQGLPPVITDPATLERVAAVLRLATPHTAPPED